MTEVSRILVTIEQGDPLAAEKLLPLVYSELRKLAAQKLAQEKPGQTLQATALVHEAYLRLEPLGRLGIAVLDVREDARDVVHRRGPGDAAPFVPACTRAPSLGSPRGPTGDSVVSSRLSPRAARG